MTEHSRLRRRWGPLRRRRRCRGHRDGKRRLGRCCVAGWATVTLPRPRRQGAPKAAPAAARPRRWQRMAPARWMGTGAAPTLDTADGASAAAVSGRIGTGVGHWRRGCCRRRSGRPGRRRRAGRERGVERVSARRPALHAARDSVACRPCGGPGGCGGVLDFRGWCGFFQVVRAERPSSGGRGDWS